MLNESKVLFYILGRYWLKKFVMIIKNGKLKINLIGVYNGND
jgi:hypothetical protein